MVTQLYPCLRMEGAPPQRERRDELVPPSLVCGYLPTGAEGLPWTREGSVR
jgi:hypothetical protein